MSCLFITGPAGSGKTTELRARIERAIARGASAFACAPSRSSLDALREGAGPGSGVTYGTIADLALEILREPPGEAEPHAPPHIVDDLEAFVIFERAAEPLLALSWSEFVESDLDPEVPGLRAPQRFLESAFRLIRKLRDAQIGPEPFLETALAAATNFYANPPNLVTPELLYYTKDAHRDSLTVTPQELQRQYRREVDLAKILAKLYGSYLDVQVRQGCLTARDAIAQAVVHLERRPAAAAAIAERYAAVFVDDAMDLTLGELILLQRIWGENLDGLTLAGDERSAISTFRGARPDRVFALPGERFEMTRQYRSPDSIERACAHLTGTIAAPGPIGGEPSELTLFRAPDKRAEAQFIAEYVGDLLRRGSRPESVALIFRSVAGVGVYEEALLERGIRVQTIGDANVLADRDALDALALLWNVRDPFRHEWLLRTLAGPAMALSDASVYALCAEPPDSQAPLFESESQSGAAARSGRWDPKRDVRLGWNVTHPEVDAQLAPTARERIERFRALLAQWVEASKTLSLPDLAQTIWRDGLARRGEPGSARAHRQQTTLARLLERIAAFAAERPDAGLGELLEYFDARMESGLESLETDRGDGSVRIASVDAVRGRSFDHVVLPNVRAGAFPLWYVPDAFLYSPALGMIPKENVGDADTARTAKFSYYMFRTKTREAYNREERRAFVYALRRARRGALVTASGPPTRGVAAPEFLRELETALRAPTPLA